MIFFSISVFPTYAINFEDNLYSINETIIFFNKSCRRAWFFSFIVRANYHTCTVPVHMNDNIIRYESSRILYCFIAFVIIRQQYRWYIQYQGTSVRTTVWTKNLFVLSYSWIVPYDKTANKNYWFTLTDRHFSIFNIASASTFLDLYFIISFDSHVKKFRLRYLSSKENQNYWLRSLIIKGVYATYNISNFIYPSSQSINKPEPISTQFYSCQRL